MDAFQFALTLLFLFTDGVMALAGVLSSGMGFFLARRKRLGRQMTYRVRQDMIGWGVIADTDYSQDADALELDQWRRLDEPHADTNAQTETLRLALAWSRMVNGSTVWCGVGMVGVSFVNALALVALLLFFRPVNGFNAAPATYTEADATYMGTLFFLLVAGMTFGVYLGMALYLIKGANARTESPTAATGIPATETLDDYRSPRIRWLFLAYALGYLILITVFAPRALFTTPGLGLWLIGASVVIAGVEVWVAERLGPVVLRWPREPLAADPALAAHAAERARVYAVAMLVCMQAMAVIFMVAGGLAAIFSLPNTLAPQDTVSPRFIAAIFIYAALGMVTVIAFSGAKGRLGGRLTGWPRFVAVRDPWEMDDAEPQ